MSHPFLMMSSLTSSLAAPVLAAPVPTAPTPSYAWRGPPGCGKRTRLLRYLAARTPHPFSLRHDTLYLNKPSHSSDPDDEDDAAGGKSIPYEESPLHLGFDVARMSMSDKVFLQSILTRWTGQQDLCLLTSTVKTRYLVLYHAHLLTDESVLQLQECLEQYDGFAILLTTELPLCPRLRDFCLEIPVGGEDHLLRTYNETQNEAPNNVWHDFFQQTVEVWSTTPASAAFLVRLRNWIYTCLQRNLRWTDMIHYWLDAIQRTPWLVAASPQQRAPLLRLLAMAESGAGWMLVTSYRIPILWEHVQLSLARELYRIRSTAPLPHPQ